jgi:hypothetical protein
MKALAKVGQLRRWPGSERTFRIIEPRGEGTWYRYEDDGYVLNETHLYMAEGSILVEEAEPTPLERLGAAAVTYEAAWSNSDPVRIGAAREHLLAAAIIYGRSLPEVAS